MKLRRVFEPLPDSPGWSKVSLSSSLRLNVISSPTTTLAHKNITMVPPEKDPVLFLFFNIVSSQLGSMTFSHFDAKKKNVKNDINPD